MLEVLRFWFTKDLVCLCSTLFFFSCYSRHLLNGRQKYIKGKLCKPYNSTLGEFFRVGGASGSDKTPVGLLSG